MVLSTEARTCSSMSENQLKALGFAVFSSIFLFLLSGRMAAGATSCDELYTTSTGLVSAVLDYDAVRERGKTADTDKAWQLTVVPAYARWSSVEDIFRQVSKTECDTQTLVAESVSAAHYWIDAMRHGTLEIAERSLDSTHDALADTCGRENIARSIDAGYSDLAAQLMRFYRIAHIRVIADPC